MKLFQNLLENMWQNIQKDFEKQRQAIEQSQLPTLSEMIPDFVPEAVKTVLIEALNGHTYDTLILLANNVNQIKPIRNQVRLSGQYAKILFDTIVFATADTTPQNIVSYINNYMKAVDIDNLPIEFYSTKTPTALIQDYNQELTERLKDVGFNDDEITEFLIKSLASDLHSLILEKNLKIEFTDLPGKNLTAEDTYYLEKIRNEASKFVGDIGIKIVKYLGQGLIGRVYLGIDSNNKLYAIKTLRPGENLNMIRNDIINSVMLKDAQESDDKYQNSDKYIYTIQNKGSVESIAVYDYAEGKDITKADQVNLGLDTLLQLTHLNTMAARAGYSNIDTKVDNLIIRSDGKIKLIDLGLWDKNNFSEGIEKEIQNIIIILKYIPISSNPLLDDRETDINFATNEDTLLYNIGQLFEKHKISNERKYLVGEYLGLYKGVTPRSLTAETMENMMLDILAMCMYHNIPIDKIPSGLQNLYDYDNLSNRIEYIYHNNKEFLDFPRSNIRQITAPDITLADVEGDFDVTINYSHLFNVSDNNILTALAISTFGIKINGSLENINQLKEIFMALRDKYPISKFPFRNLSLIVATGILEYRDSTPNINKDLGSEIEELMRQSKIDIKIKISPKYLQI